MTGTEVIRQVQENASEWLEMTDSPAELLAGILAEKIVKLTSHIEYLERRLAYDSSKSRNN